MGALRDDASVRDLTNPFSFVSCCLFYYYYHTHEEIITNMVFLVGLEFSFETETDHNLFQERETKFILVCGMGNDTAREMFSFTGAHYNSLS